MKRKILKYLQSKNESEYTDFDKILSLHIHGELEKILYKCGYFNIEIFVTTGKKSNNLQVSASYFNLGIGVDFFDEKYDYFIYDLNNSSILSDDEIENEYKKDFSAEKFFEEIFDLLEHDERLNNERENIATMSHSDMRNYSKKFGKKKIYKIISYICLMLPIIIACGVGAYVLFSGEKQYFHPIVYILFILPIVFYLFFNYKSKK